MPKENYGLKGAKLHQARMVYSHKHLQIEAEYDRSLVEHLAHNKTMAMETRTAFKKLKEAARTGDEESAGELLKKHGRSILSTELLAAHFEADQRNNYNVGVIIEKFLVDRVYEQIAANILNDEKKSTTPQR